MGSTCVLELRSVFGTGGGPEKTILLGTARTDSAAFQITVCYLRSSHDDVYKIDARARALGVKYVEIAERHSLDPAIWRQLVSLACETRAQIVHSHDYKTDVLAWLLARRLGILALATAHGWTGHSMRERLLYYPLDKRVLARFPAVIAVSGEIRTELIRHGARPDRVQVVLNGIDDKAFHRDATRVGEARARLRLAPQTQAIGSVGRLEPQKRFDVLMESFAMVRREHPDAVLLIAGDGSLRSSLEDLRQRLELGDACRLLGHVDDVAGLHHGLDLFVQSSDYEGTPNSVLEAMAFETPVVATDAGGTGELIRDHLDGVVVPRGKTVALAQAMNEALSDPPAAVARARTARRRIESELSFDVRMRKVESIYRHLVNAGRFAAA